MAVRQRSLPAAGRGAHRRDRPHGGHHLPRQTTGDRVPVVRDLRRAPLVLGLRPARRRTASQHPQCLVAHDGAAARRRRGPGGGRHHVPPRLGGQRPRERVHRCPRGVPQLPSALARGPPGARGGRGRALPEVRGDHVHRAQAVQPDVRDAPRAGQGRRAQGVPASGDGAGHVRGLHADPDRLATEAPLRDRADRQELPQRDHAAQLHLPDPGVRTDGDGVLRGAGSRRGVVRLLGGPALPVVPRPRRARGEAPPSPARAR